MKNQNILIIGGCGLIGSDLVQSLTEAGHTVFSFDQKQSQLCESFLGNITHKSELVQTFKTIKAKHQTIDSVINCAYPKNNTYGSKLEKVTYESFCENHNLHLGGYFLAMKTAANFFIEQGHGNYINFSSIYGVIAPKFEIYKDTKMTMPVEYASIKSAIIHLTKYFAKYYTGKNIRFNCVSPGGILNGQEESFLSDYKKHCSSKGMLNKEDVRGIIAFLVSETSINGQNLVIDDGFSL